MRVLITRPLDLAIPLAEKLSKLGMEPEIFPVIDIQPTPFQTALEDLIKTLDKVDIAIWISQAAVHHSAPLIHHYWKILPQTKWAAIGTGTANALKKYQLQPVITPLHPPYESESLLALKPFQEVKNRNIVIFRGNGGRPLLSEVLQQRGANLKIIETYQRLLPTVDMVERLSMWRHTSIDVIIITSQESLKNLVQLVGKDVSWLKNIPIIVSGERMKVLADQLGFKTTWVSHGAEDAAIIQQLCHLGTCP